MTEHRIRRFAARMTAKLGNAGTFLVVSLLAGVLLAGLAMPFAAGVGLAARSGAEAFQGVEVSDLTIQPLAGRSTMVASDGTPIATFYEQNRNEVPLSQVAPVMQEAMIAIEDSRFYEHGPVDLRGILRSLLVNLEERGVEQGASTLTMQYARNLLITQADTREEINNALRETPERKIEEIKYAIALEAKYSKDEILQGYLNTVYFGNSAYGVDIAARQYFGVHASQLNLPQAAMLAGLVQSPIAYDPTRNINVATDRRNVVLDRMVAVGDITVEQADAAKATPIQLNVPRTANGCIASTQPFFCDYTYRWLLTRPELGSTVEAREQLVRSGAVTIKTTMNATSQAAAQEAISSRVEPTNPVATAEAVVQPGTGQVWALATSKGFGQSDDLSKTTVNYAVNKEFGESSGFQAGSTFKIFTVAAAMEKGVSLYEHFPGVSTEYTGFKNCQTGAPYPPYKPANSTSAGPNPTLLAALAMSVNSALVGLEEQITQCAAANAATRFGLTRADGTPVSAIPSFTLGVDTVSPLNMAEAIATVAARGKRCETYPVLEVLDREGQPLLTPQPDCQQVMDPQWADATAFALQAVMKPGGTGWRVALDRASAGKTGTTNNNVAVWFVGFTPNLVATVWTGNPNNSNYPLERVTIHDQYWPVLFGSTFCGPIWHDTMEATLANMPVVEFQPPPATSIDHLETVVPDVRGLSRDEAVARLGQAGFRWRVAANRYWSDYPAETVALTDPAAGRTVESGSTVTIYISGGPQSPPATTPTPSPSGGGGTGQCPPGAICPPGPG